MKRFKDRRHWLSVSLILMFMLVPSYAFAQNKAKDKKIEVTIQVVNENNEPIPGASIVVGEGLIHAVTDVNGQYVVSAKLSAALTITMIGYDKYTGFIAPLVNDGKVVLKTAAFLKSSDDIVNIPFGSTYQRYTTDNMVTLTSEDISKYPTSDLRNALVGLFPGYISKEMDGQPGLQAEESTGKYGIKTKVEEEVRGQSVVYVIDDVQVDISEMPLDPEEVESVTLLKDPVSKSLFGPAAQAIIYIKTKRGHANERKLHVNMEAGISVVDRFPEFTTGVDYAKMNNLARINDGLTPLYTTEAIAEYAKNDPYNMLYPNINYRDMLFKNTRSYQRVNLASSGGNEKVQYASYIGYTGEGDIYKIGSKADYNRLNVRTNLDVKFNQRMKLRFDFAADLNLRRSPNYGNGEYIHEFTPLIADVTTYSPIAFPVYTGISESTGRPTYGISRTFTYNPIGGLESSGYYKDLNRSGIANMALDIDLGHLLKGLKSVSYMGFNGSYLTRVGKDEDYGAYYVTPNPENELGYDLKKVRDEKPATGKSKLHDYYNIRFMAYERLSYEREFGDMHQVKAGLTMLYSKLIRETYKEPIRQANGIFDLNYILKNRYIFQGTVNYVGSSYYASKNRYKMFPTFGAAWILSDENFMQNLNHIDYFKLRAQAGQIGDITYKSDYKYESNWKNSGTDGFGYPGIGSSWFGSNTSSSSKTYYSTLGNPNLDWEYWNEFTVGAEMMFFNRKLWIDFAYYNRTKNGIIDQLSNLYPDYLGFQQIPYTNYKKTRYSGYELALSYRDKVGDLHYRIGVNLTRNQSKTLVYNDLNYPDNEWYRRREGTAGGGLYGLVCLGKYASDEEAANDPVKSAYSSNLKGGDLRYQDLNGDGVINDADVTRIGETTPDLYYALNINLVYKGFELTAVGTGIAGSDGFLPSSYYRSGSGDNNYSTWVRDNIGGAYPRLTYYKVDHNFENSTFWMRSMDYFKLQNVELAYNLPAKVCDYLGVGGIRVFARGSNLLTLSGIKETDPESLTSGINRYPLYSTYVGGFKITF